MECEHLFALLPILQLESLAMRDYWISGTNVSLVGLLKEIISRAMDGLVEFGYLSFMASNHRLVPPRLLAKLVPTQELDDGIHKFHQQSSSSYPNITDRLRVGNTADVNL